VRKLFGPRSWPASPSSATATHRESSLTSPSPSSSGPQGRPRFARLFATIPRPVKDAQARAGFAGRRSLTGLEIAADAGHGLGEAGPALAGLQERPLKDQCQSRGQRGQRAFYGTANRGPRDVSDVAVASLVDVEHA
jgi:hypothetical protein